jgi:hypothetical protein
MPKLKIKTLAFYTIAISSVLLLFKTVTAYGENNLKAPIAISGRYRLTDIENLPNCPKSDTLMLNIQQSGMFLNGSLLSTTNTKEISPASENNLSLIGKLNNQQLTLSGKVSKAILCNNPTPQTSVKNQSQPDNVNLSIQATLNPQGGFNGQITTNDTSKPIKFSAIEEKSQNPNSNSPKP